jgi:steroid delta-isomerase-like uncharacterized protein
MGDAEVKIVQRWFQEVWNERRGESIGALLRPDAVCHAATGDIAGADAWKAQFWEPFMAAFSDIKIVLDRVLSQDQEAAVRWTVSMRHTAPFLGIPASGKTVSAYGTTWLRVEDGHLAEGWDTWDLTGLLVDIGAPVDVLKRGRSRA